MNKLHYRSILKDIHWIVGSFIIHRDRFLFIPSNRGRGLLYLLLFLPQLLKLENKNKSSTPKNIVRFGLSENCRVIAELTCWLLPIRRNLVRLP